MTEIPAPGDRGFVNPRVHEIEHCHELYRIINFTEAEFPEGAIRAQQIQGESYEHEEFVYSTARDTDGRLFPELDRSRGDNVTYFLALPKIAHEGRRNEGAMRIIDIPVGGSIDDLAAFRYSEATMDSAAAAMLRAKVAKEGPGSVREVSALSHTNDASTLATLELIRLAVQQAIRGKTQELWLITFAPSAYMSIAARFSRNTMLQVGPPVPVDVGDPRTSDTLRLTPVVIEPCRLPEQMMEYILNGAESDRDRRNVLRTLRFVLDGLRDDELSSEVVSFVASLKPEAA